MPRTDRVLPEPAHDPGPRRLGDPTLDGQPVNVSRGATRERAAIARRLARERLDLGCLLRGESGPATRPRFIVNLREAKLVKPSSPPPDQTRRRIQLDRNLRVMQTLGRIENNPRALHILKRQLLRPRTALQHHALLIPEHDLVARRATHRRYITSPPTAPLLLTYDRYLRPRLLDE